MVEDLVAGLTRQVKEEVIENYLFERRLIELQRENLSALAGDVLREAGFVGLRLARLSSLMVEPDVRHRLRDALGMRDCPFWDSCMDVKFERRVRLIRVRGLTMKGKYRGIVLESYSRLYACMKRYRERYKELVDECSAVNSNIESFQKNFDLISILSFLRGLDIRGMEAKNILGDNFTAKDLAELDKRLFISPESVDKFHIPACLNLPAPGLIRGKLCNLAEEVFLRCSDKVKKTLQW